MVLMRLPGEKAGSAGCPGGQGRPHPVHKVAHSKSHLETWCDPCPMAPPALLEKGGSGALGTWGSERSRICLKSTSW